MKKRRLLFGRKAANINSEKAQEAATSSNISSLYESIYDLPFSNFISCIADNNLAALIKTGFPPIEALQVAWASIYEQYSDAIADNEAKLYLSLYKEITRLQIAIEEINKLVDVLKNFFVPQFITRLNKILNTAFVFDVKNPEDYDNKLQRCLNRSKGFLINLEIKKSEFEAIKNKNEGKEKVNLREYFSSMLNILSKHNAYRINSSEITVFDYIDLLKSLNRHNEEVKQSLNKR